MARDRVFYDGDCGLCHRSVRFLLARDRDGSRFLFAPLQGETFETRVPESERETLADSLVVRTADGRLLQRAAGVFHLLRRVGGVWSLAARIGALLPAAWTDGLYDRVAAARQRWFARPAASCPVVAGELRDRFEP